jgi:Fur family iron response transcriptional regulator
VVSKRWPDFGVWRPPKNVAEYDRWNKADQLQSELRLANLLPTRQRIALGSLLFGGDDRHVTAEALYEQAISMKTTVYNTLHRFAEAGLLNRIVVGGSRIYFDTNTMPHHHFVLEETNELFDLTEGALSVRCFRETPEGL